MNKKVRFVLTLLLMALSLFLCISYLNPYFTIPVSLIVLLIARYTEVTDGDFIVDYSDPEKDIYRIEIAVPLGEIEKRRTITFRIRKK